MIKKKPTKKSTGKKLQINVRDLKTKKDAKGGAAGLCQCVTKGAASLCTT